PMTTALLTSHVLDLQTGRPAVGLAVRLYAGAAGAVLTTGVTDDDGRVGQWQDDVVLQQGEYRLVFVTGDWFERQGRTTLYPRITVEFSVAGTGQHYHIPLLLSPFGYSTYRGS
ncbi:MAG TPA: hydroxyisourate hydrolase, partial [Kineobactrum sp.]